MKKIILNAVPPFACNIPSPALSILKAWLEKNNYEVSIIYWNLYFHKMQNDFIWNNFSLLETSSHLGLYVNYLLLKDQHLVQSEVFKRIIQGRNTRHLAEKNDFYYKHMTTYAKKMDALLDEKLSKIDFSDVLFLGFSLKTDGWIFSSIVARKIKAMHSRIPIVIGGISSREKAKVLLENFPQFDMAMWGEGENAIVNLANMLSNRNGGHSNLINTAYRMNGEICYAFNNNDFYINLSAPDIYPNYDDYFQQKEELNLNFDSIIPIEGSRGCHWNQCKFCYLNTDYKYRIKSSDKVYDEILYMIKKYHIYSFEFLDNDFIGLHPNKAIKLLDKLISIKENTPKFKVVLVEVITKGINHAMIKKLFDAGIELVQIGYESTSQNLLKKIDKKSSFASNLIFVKFSTLYRVPLGNVNLIVNMPDECVEDILEAINNLFFLRFFLHPLNFRHNLIPLQVNYSSRYFDRIKGSIAEWNLSLVAYDLLKEYILEKDQWIIFDYIKNGKHYLWETFKNVERFYLDNKYTYTLCQINDTILYREKVNGKLISEYTLLKDSIEWYILINVNDEILSFQTLFAKANLVFKGIAKVSLQSILNKLMKWGLLYHTSDFSEIISIIYIPQNLNTWTSDNEK